MSPAMPSSTVVDPAVVLVTGASRGLGRGIALELAQAGFSVALHFAKNREAAEETRDACRERAQGAHQRFALVSGDVAREAEREAIVATTLSELGRLDALVNNAGIAPRERADLLVATEASFDEVMAVNLKGPYFLSQRVAGHFLRHPNGSRLPGGYKLIFVSSMSAHTASVNRGDYCVSKAGLGMVAQLFAVRLAAEGVQVFDLRPGIMETDMTAGVRAKYDALIADGVVPQARWGTPRDVGQGVVAVMSGQFPFSTGEIVHIDGGAHLRRL
jgi:3-oxoacyl-[acyl-carrier protein] reductase